MDDLRYEALAKRSRAIHGQKHVLPVAVWLHEAGEPVVKAPEIGRGLEGRLQSGEILLVLDRLSKVEAVRELSHPGAPYPKYFEILGEHAYWPFVAAVAEGVDLEDGEQAKAASSEA